MPVFSCQRQMSLGVLGHLLIASLSFTGNLLAVESRFDSDAEGWTITDSGATSGDPAEYSGSGGHPSGHIFHEEGLLAIDDWYFRAPAKFHGNFSGAYGTRLSYDLRQDDTGEDFYLDGIYLRGGGLTLTMQTVPPGTTWTSYSVPLIESAGWRLGSRAPTRNEMLSVLVDVSDLQIRGEFQLGRDIGGLDNVVFPTQPTPDLAGDYDRNGAVDVGDYQLWRSTKGSTTILLADGNANGAIDLADYPVWRNNLGAVLPEAVSIRTVPEPPPWLLGVLAAICGMLFRWLV